MQKSTKIGLSWSITNLICWTLLLTGLICPAAWAYNIFVFVTWIYTILWLLVAIVPPGEDDHVISDEDPIPLWVRVASDSGMVLVLSGFGHWFIATLVVIQIFAESTARQKRFSTPS